MRHELLLLRYTYIRIHITNDEIIVRNVKLKSYDKPLTAFHNYNRLCGCHIRRD